MKTVIIVRKDLGLSTGKLVAQTSHAVFRALSDSLFANQHNPVIHGRGANLKQLPNSSAVIYNDPSQLPVCIVCYVKSEEALMKLHDRASGYIRVGLQVDARHNEVPEGTKTVLCLGPTTNDSELKMLNEITRNLQTLRD